MSAASSLSSLKGVEPPACLPHPADVGTGLHPPPPPRAGRGWGAETRQHQWLLFSLSPERRVGRWRGQTKQQEDKLFHHVCPAAESSFTSPEWARGFSAAVSLLLLKPLCGTVAVVEQGVPRRSGEAQDDSTHAVVYPGGTWGCVFVQTLLPPLAVADIGFMITCILKLNFIPGLLKSWLRLPFGVGLFVCFTYRNCGNTSSTSMRQVKTEMLSSRIQPGVAKDTAEKDSVS